MKLIVWRGEGNAGYVDGDILNIYPDEKTEFGRLTFAGGNELIQIPGPVPDWWAGLAVEWEPKTNSYPASFMAIAGKATEVDPPGVYKRKRRYYWDGAAIRNKNYA